MAHWTTPPATIPGKELSIGEINYGIESRMFVFAYRDTNTSGVVTDTSFPAYNKLAELTVKESQQYENDNNIIIMPNDEVLTLTTEVPLLYTDKGVVLDSGLRIASNGQIVGTLKISDKLKNIIFKVQYVDVPEYSINTLYRAYTQVQSNGRIYQLRSSASVPITTETDTPDALLWEDIGSFKPQFSTIDNYVPNSTYTTGNYVVSDGKLWQLNTTITHMHRAETTAPNKIYWRDDGAYDQNTHNPTADYVQGKQYNVPQVYVKHNNIVYRLRLNVQLPYTAVTGNPSEDAWETIGLVYSNVYTVNTVYSRDDTVVHNGRVYLLKTTLPYKSSATVPDIAFWDDKGQYTVPSANTFSRIFRIVINTQKGSFIDFETLPDLHNLRIGEQVGELFNNDIVADKGKVITYSIDKEMLPIPGVPLVATNGYYPYLPKGLTLCADGRMSGKVKGPIGKYFFDVLAQNPQGMFKSQRFYLNVIPGYKENTFSCSLRLSQVHEREWYSIISNGIMNNIAIYRESDPLYGLKTKPEILLKDNILGMLDTEQLTFDTAVSYIRSKLNEEPIQCRVGNMRYRTALDVNGAPLYDYVYKELVSLSAYIGYDIKGHVNPVPLAPITALKERIVNMLLSDDEQLTTPLRAFTINNGTQIYADSCQLWQTNPDTINNAVPGVFATLPVAYVNPGEGQKFIDAAAEQGILSDMMFNKTVTLDTLVLTQHSDEFDRQVTLTLTSS